MATQTSGLHAKRQAVHPHRGCELLKKQKHDDEQSAALDEQANIAGLESASVTHGSQIDVCSC